MNRTVIGVLLTKIIHTTTPPNGLNFLQIYHSSLSMPPTYSPLGSGMDLLLCLQKPLVQSLSPLDWWFCCDRLGAYQKGTPAIGCYLNCTLRQSSTRWFADPYNRHSSRTLLYSFRPCPSILQKLHATELLLLATTCHFARKLPNL